MVEKSHTSGFWPQFYDPLRNLGSRVADWFAPAAEAATDGDAYRIVMELPGVAEGDLEVSVAEGVVTVKGEKKSEREERGETWFFSEREYGAFSRSFRLPPDADGEKVSAELRDGVLSVTVPKRGDLTPEGGRSVPIRKG